MNGKSEARAELVEARLPLTACLSVLPARGGEALLRPIGAGLVYMLGVMVGNRRQGWAIYAAMLILFLVVTSGMYFAEGSGNPNFRGINQTARSVAPTWPSLASAAT